MSLLPLGCGALWGRGEGGLVERAGLGDPGRAYQAILARGARLAALRLYGRMQLQSPELQRDGAFVLLLDRGDRLRFEALSANDVTLATLVVQGGRFTSYDRARNRCVQGAFDGRVRLGDWEIHVSLREFLGLLTATSTQPAGRRLRLLWDPRDKARVLEVGDANRRTWYTLHDTDRGGPGLGAGPARGAVLVDRIRVVVGDEVLMDVHYEAFGRTREGAVLPRWSTWDLPRRRTHVSLRVQRAQVALPLPDAAFSLDCPPGATRAELVGGGQAPGHGRMGRP